VESFFKLRLLKLAGFDLIKDGEYLRQRKVAAETKAMLSLIDSAEDASRLDIKYLDIREINKLIDSPDLYPSQPRWRRQRSLGPRKIIPVGRVFGYAFISEENPYGNLAVFRQIGNGFLKPDIYAGNLFRRG